MDGIGYVVSLKFIRLLQIIMLRFSDSQLNSQLTTHTDNSY